MRNVDRRRTMPRCKSRRAVCDPLSRSFLMDGYRFVMPAGPIRNDRSQLVSTTRRQYRFIILYKIPFFSFLSTQTTWDDSSYEHRVDTNTMTDQNKPRPKVSLSLHPRIQPPTSGPAQSATRLAELTRNAHCLGDFAYNQHAESLTQHDVQSIHPRQGHAERHHRLPDAPRR